MSLPDKPRLVVFDVEGVLIPKNRFFFEVAKTLGLLRLLRVLIYGFLYEVGILKLEVALRRIYRVLRGVELETLLQIFSRIPATPYLQNLCGQLKARNCKVALISSGIPTVAAQRLAAELCADYAYGVEVEVKDGKLTGEIYGDAISKNGKLTILCDILNQEGMLVQDCIVVADDRNNRCIFLPGTLKIGFNPDDTRGVHQSLTNLKLALPWTVVFHELAEAYAKVDGGKGNSYSQSHAAAIERENQLRDQRPYLKEYNPGSGGTVGQPDNKIIIKK